MNASELIDSPTAPTPLVNTLVAAQVSTAPQPATPQRSVYKTEMNCDWVRARSAIRFALGLCVNACRDFPELTSVIRSPA